MVWKLLLALLGFSWLVLVVAELASGVRQQAHDRQTQQAGAVPAAKVALDPLDPTSPAYDPRALLEHLKAEKARQDASRGPDGLTPGERSIAEVVREVVREQDRAFMRLFAQRLRTDSSLRNDALEAGIDLSLDGPYLGANTQQALELVGQYYDRLNSNLSGFDLMLGDDSLYQAWKERGSPMPKERGSPVPQDRR